MRRPQRGGNRSPAAAPELVKGLRLGLANAWLFLVAAELIASSKGLGFLLSDAALGTLERRMVRRRN
jgi:sulfonate transport system permease protein